jgi:hypothetical protein
MFVVDFRLNGPGDRFPWSLIVESAEWTIVGPQWRTSFLDPPGEIKRALVQLEGRTVTRLDMTAAGDLNFGFDGDWSLSIPSQSPAELAEGPAWYFVWSGLFSFGADKPNHFTFEPATEAALSLEAQA